MTNFLEIWRKWRETHSSNTSCLFLDSNSNWMRDILRIARGQKLALKCARYRQVQNSSQVCKCHDPTRTRYLVKMQRSLSSLQAAADTYFFISVSISWSSSCFAPARKSWASSTNRSSYSRRCSSIFCWHPDTKLTEIKNYIYGSPYIESNSFKSLYSISKWIHCHRDYDISYNNR